MKRSFLTLLLIAILCFKGYNQSLGLKINERYFKTIGYLEICTDQLKTGLFKSISDFNFDSSFIDSIKLIPLKSTGFDESLIFYGLSVKYPYEMQDMSYSFCYDQNSRDLYKLKGFYDNDFYSFLQSLQGKGYKITSQYFSKNQIAVEDLDISCLIELYRGKKNKPLSERDRNSTPCLKYNFQPVITY